jgi:16S rRNA (cytosine1402-N4)-methyltransferase
MEFTHVPVLLAEAVEYLNCRDGAIIVDCTLGGGGHAEAILNRITPTGFLLGIDQDEAAIDAARVRLGAFSQHFKLIRDDFGRLKDILSTLKIPVVDGILFDLGVSSFQLEEPERGFSYRFPAPLDMRMDRRQKNTAADIVNSYSEDRLVAVLKRYGEEPWANRIARFMVEARKRKPIETTDELVRIIKDAIPASARRRGGHPAKRTFQALRIEVNGELEGLDRAIFDAATCLKKGGRLVVISYHSLEDRITKNCFRQLTKGCICPEDLQRCECREEYKIDILTKKPVRPTAEEIKFNPRARSAKLRAAERL